MLTAVCRQWGGGFMLWTVCPLSTSLVVTPDCICLLRNPVVLSLPLGLFLTLTLLTSSQRDCYPPPYHLDSKRSFLFPLLARTRSSERDENRPFQLGGEPLKVFASGCRCAAAPSAPSEILLSFSEPPRPSAPHPSTSFPAQPGGTREAVSNF